MTGLLRKTNWPLCGEWTILEFFHTGTSCNRFSQKYTLLLGMGLSFLPTGKVSLTGLIWNMPLIEHGNPQNMPSNLETHFIAAEDLTVKPWPWDLSIISHTVLPKLLRNEQPTEIWNGLLKAQLWEVAPSSSQQGHLLNQNFLWHTAPIMKNMWLLKPKDRIKIGPHPLTFPIV